MQLVELYKKLSNTLKTNNLPYIIVGGQAALLYREPRFTNDIDIIIGTDNGSLETVLRICNEINLRVLVSDPEEFVEQTMVLPATDDESNMRVDFIFSDTKYEAEAIERANFVNYDGCEVPFCCLEDLIILKIFAGRVRDIDDVKAIIRKNPEYNRKLIMENLRMLGNLIDIDLENRFADLEK